MQITITTMKYRNKNYISLGTFCFFLIPIIGLTVLGTYLACDSFEVKRPDFFTAPKPASDTAKYDPPVDTPEFAIGDEAVFNFTGDTVLVLNQPENLDELNGEVRVLHKTPQGGLEALDLPDNWLVKVVTDTVTAQKPAPLPDKLEKYKKTLTK